MVIGYFAFCRFDQGLDILTTLSLSATGVTFQHTIMAYLAVSWWSWQTFRSARTFLHFSHFNFWSYQPAYSIRAQVFVPRFLAMVPYLIVAWGVFIAHGKTDPFFYLLVSSAIWIFVFLHVRKQLIVWIRARKPHWGRFIPDYIPIKNGSYPASFIWSKQHSWIWFRMLVVVALFAIVYYFPISFPRYVGSAAIVLLAYGCWLILASVLTFLEKYLRFPISFTVVMLLFLFSFTNNNHELRTVNGEVHRPGLEEHFTHWVKNRSTGDSLNVYLVMAEGGGIRSAYWTSGVVRKLHDTYPDFTTNMYALSGVSGGSLSLALVAATHQMNPDEQWRVSREMLKEDYLAPVTGALTFQDMLQRFLPIPVYSFDRMRVLEFSWEQSWSSAAPNLKGHWADGFVQSFSSMDMPLVMLNSTHVESGYRAVMSNVSLTELDLDNIKDLVAETGQDYPISTAVGMSSRFPFLTPPARVKTPDGKIWGSLVDGGYYENLGVGTMMDVYEYLLEISKRKQLPVRFHFIAIRNTKTSQSEEPVRGLFELTSPVLTFSNIWENTGNLALERAQDQIELRGDKLTEIHLIREDHENIPLGWYLSSEARANIDRQLEKISIE